MYFGDLLGLALEMQAGIVLLSSPWAPLVPGTLILSPWSSTAGSTGPSFWTIVEEKTLGSFTIASVVASLYFYFFFFLFFLFSSYHSLLLFSAAYRSSRLFLLTCVWRSIATVALLFI